jgi:hypothetical protein
MGLFFDFIQHGQKLDNGISKVRSTFFRKIDKLPLRKELTLNRMIELGGERNRNLLKIKCLQFKGNWIY